MRTHARATAPLALAPFILAIFGTLAQAQSPSQTLDAQLAPTVVTASRTEQKLTDALAATTVISRQDIENRQATDLPSLLRGQAGIEIVQNGGPGTSVSFFMRGANANSALVLIDGVPVSSATLGTTAIGQLQLSQIDHIEIVRGNVSALYGSQAIGGVVQIFTRKGGDHAPRAYAEVGYGRYNTTQANAGIGGTLGEDGKTRFSLNASRFHTSGFSAQNPAQMKNANPNNNGYDNTSVSAQLSHQFAEDWEVGTRFYQSDGATSIDSSGKPTDLNDLDSRVRQLSAYVNGKVTAAWLTKFSVTQGDDYSYSYRNGIGNGNVHTASHQIDWQNEYALTPAQKLLAGYTRLEQTVEGSTNFNHNNRHVDSGYAGYQGDFGRHQIQANVRRDQYSDFGGANSYFAGYGFLVTQEWKLLANMSNAFRAPTFNDLFYPGFGNPNLQPERAISKELGVQYAGALGIVRLTGFQTNYSNLIQTVTVAPGVSMVQNVARARVRGAELTYTASLFGVDVRASGTMQNPTDEESGKTLVRRARRYANLSLSKAFGKVRVGGDVFYSGERADTLGQPLGAYAIVNLQTRYDIDKSWYVAAHVDNLFNKKYQTVYGYNTPGVGVYVTLGWKQF